MKTTDDRSDTELLLAYGRDGDEAAFEALARRHVDMIFGVSFRRSNNRQLAEEATQNVLLGLSRKARKLSSGESNLGAWLHQSTKFEVAKLLRRESRIRKREQAYASETMSTTTQDEDQTFRRLYPLLDQAIDHLRASDREVIVRRYLEGQSFSRIGQALGISEDTAQKRTSRAFGQLNRFFKRKAGVTVSAAALAAGISQHCVEAAPATCLNILGNAAASGIGAGTIITIMSTKKIAAIAAGIALLGGTAAVITTRDSSPPQTVSSPSPVTATPPPPSDGADAGARLRTERPFVAKTAASRGDEADYSPNRELARLEAMNIHPGKDEFARRLSEKHDQTLKDLAADLGLSEAQVASVKAVLEARLKAFRTALDADHPQGELEMAAEAGGIILGEGLRDSLKGILSEEQFAAFDEHEAEAWQSQVESRAYHELSKITPVLELSEEQKDRVFELLQASSEESLKATSNLRAYLALEKRQPAALVDLPDQAVLDFLGGNIAGESPAPGDSEDFKDRIIKAFGEGIDKRVEVLAPVLDERQQKLYREHLENETGLNGSGIPFPTNK